MALLILPLLLTPPSPTDLGKANDAVLRGHVGTLVDGADAPVHARHVDDAAPLRRLQTRGLLVTVDCTGPVGHTYFSQLNVVVSAPYANRHLHGRERRLDGHEVARKVDVKHPAPGRQGKGLDGSHVLDPSVVHLSRR